MKNKVCGKCGILKNVNEFYIDYRRKVPRDKCIECFNESQKQWRQNRKEYLIQWRIDNKPKRDEWKKENLEHIKEYKKNYRKSENHLNYMQSYRQTDSHKQRRREIVKNRYDNDLNYKIKTNLRNRINAALKNGKKSKKSIELLGCDIETARKHIESQFAEGMSWENWKHEIWHIDHIIPCASFDLIDPKQQKKCFHYTNLQPLWAKDNLSKGAKII